MSRALAVILPAVLLGFLSANDARGAGQQKPSCAPRPGAVGYSGFGSVFETEGGRAEVRIAEVKAGTPAAEAGLAAGDRIVAIDGEPLRARNQYEWIHDLAASRPGDVLHLTVRRGDAPPREVALTLVEPPEGWEEGFSHWLLHRRRSEAADALEWLGSFAAGRTIEITFRRGPACRLDGEAAGVPLPRPLSLAAGLMLLPVVDRLHADDSLVLRVSYSAGALRIDPSRLPPYLSQADLVRAAQEMVQQDREHDG